MLKSFFSLEEGGATALGPALYLSILIASRKKESQVILCTDGLANRFLFILFKRDYLKNFKYFLKTEVLDH